MSHTLEEEYIDIIGKVQECLKKYVSESSIPNTKLRESCIYSLFSGGKRYRPFLTVLTSRALNGNDDAAIRLGCALELIHNYSLIHDDLPCMDNDDFRHGKPSSHKKFGEYTAVLTGDALLTDAFYLVSTTDTLNSKALLKAVQVLSDCAGSRGMIYGQMLDLSMQDSSYSKDEYELLCNLKTGKLLIASVQLGLLAAGIEDPHIWVAFTSFASQFAYAYQLQDDLLDVKEDFDMSHTCQPSICAFSSSDEAIEEYMQSYYAAYKKIEPYDQFGFFKEFITKIKYRES